MTSNDADDPPGRSRLRWLTGTAALLAVPVAVVWWPGCREYPAVTSKAALQHMKLLYAACNTKDPVRLGRVEAGVERLAREGKMTPAEQRAFAEIIGMAKAGDWERAERASFKFAEDQVGQGDPDRHDGHDHHQHPPKKGKPKG